MGRWHQAARSTCRACYGPRRCEAQRSRRPRPAAEGSWYSVEGVLAAYRARAYAPTPPAPVARTRSSRRAAVAHRRRGTGTRFARRHRSHAPGRQSPGRGHCVARRARLRWMKAMLSDSVSSPIRVAHPPAGGAARLTAGGRLRYTCRRCRAIQKLSHPRLSAFEAFGVQPSARKHGRG